jgi:hypothetical protein
MEIRKATLSDIADISRIHAISWKYAYQGLIPQQFLDELEEDYWVERFTKSISKYLTSIHKDISARISSGRCCFRPNRCLPTIC